MPTGWLQNRMATEDDSEHSDQYRYADRMVIEDVKRMIKMRRKEI